MSTARCVDEAKWAASLTRRERSVLVLVETGASVRDMAIRLELSEGTLKTHLRHIYRKLGIHNRVQAASFARRLRLGNHKNHENG